jgi:NAD+ diphosphatase
MIFKPGFTPPYPTSDADWWFIIDNGKLLVKEDPSGYAIPRKSDMAEVLSPETAVRFLGYLDATACYAARWPSGTDLSLNLKFANIRSLFESLEHQVILAAGCAAQLLGWHQAHRYCGACGAEMEDKTTERAKFCPRCKAVYYPRLSPAVIMAVTKDDRILLARSKRFYGNMFSVLAGFVEPGERVEACVEREVFEETGITVRNITYFGSQPWPFPDSLMLGFTAEYAAGEIRVDASEIVEAGWFSADNLPPTIPNPISIARKLIDWFVARQKGKSSCTS